MDTIGLVDALMVLGFVNKSELAGSQWWVNRALGMTVTFNDVPSPDRIHVRFPWSHVHAVTTVETATEFFRAASRAALKDWQTGT